MIGTRVIPSAISDLSDLLEHLIIGLIKVNVGNLGGVRVNSNLGFIPGKIRGRVFSKGINC